MNKSFFDFDKSYFFICEIGINHNGDFELAKKMIDIAAEAGVDAVKFQMRQLDDLYEESVLSGLDKQDLGLQQNVDFIKKSQLNFKEFKTLSEHSKSKGVIFACTPWDLKSVDVLEKLESPFYKVASADLSNFELIDKILKTKKPIILSTGMSLKQEVDKTYKYLMERNADFALLHCNSAYPADFKDINLNFMREMMKNYKVPIGYSGHERGVAVTTAAFTMGAKILERHLTLDKNMSGPDHKASLEPDELKELMLNLKQVDLSLGSGVKKVLTQGVVMNKETLGKSLIANKKIKKGEIITRSTIKIKSPGRGLSPYYLDQLVGVKATRNLNPGDYFLEEDVKKISTKLFKKQLNYKWGIPVRFHDVNKMIELFNPDFVEFHMGYKDVLETKFPAKIPKNIDFKIHIPEIWPNGFILDLAASSSESRKKSIEYVQKTIDVVESFVKKFKLKNKKVEFIIHVGGHSQSTPITDKKELKLKYKHLAEGLNFIRDKNPHVTLLPENMPPLPWFLGGQMFCNIFTEENFIIDFCEKEKFSICLDSSHAYLYSKYSGSDFFEYMAKLIPYTKHLHIADAQGTDGEGLSVGKGEVEFDKLLKLLKSLNYKGSLIAEIWQGHKFNAKGFSQSLLELKKLGY
jgi:N-acetylneuraminate synthase